jgi:hypothetical protein
MANDFERGVKTGLRAAAQYLDSEADGVVSAAAARKLVATLMTAEELAQYLRRHAREVRALVVREGRR